MIFEFRLILNPIEMTEALGNALYEAGCDDGTLGESNGVAFRALSSRGKRPRIGDSFCRRRRPEGRLRGGLRQDRTRLADTVVRNMKGSRPHFHIHFRIATSGQFLSVFGRGGCMDSRLSSNFDRGK